MIDAQIDIGCILLPGGDGRHIHCGRWDMGTGVVTLLAMLAFSCVIWQWKKERRFSGVFIYGQLYFWSTHILVSAMLMWLDIYRIWYASAGTLIIALAVLLVSCAVYRKKRTGKKGGKVCDRQDICVLIFCILMAVCMHEKNELYGMSQDEGVYQTMAISYMCGNNDNQRTMQEYGELREEDKPAFLNKLNDVISHGMHGYYLFCGDYIPQNMQEQYSETSGYYHGVPTYAATMALWGSIFGWKNMMGVQTLFYVLAVLLFYEMLRKMNLSALKRAVLLVIYMFSPIMVWLGKSSLCELLLACLINWFLYELMWEESRSFQAVRIALPILTFAFTHLSIYTLMPMFVVCMLIRFWNDRSLVFLKAGLYISAGYLAGILFTAWCYTEYFYMNVNLLTRLPFIDNGNVLLILCLCGAGSAALFVVLYLYKRNLPRLSIGLRIWGLRIVAGIFTVESIWVIIRTFITEGPWDKLTILTYILLTGIVTLPAVLFFLIGKTKIFCSDGKSAIITWFFLYCVLIYAMLFRRWIINHYYGDRYLAPFIVGILLMMGIVLERTAMGRLGHWLFALCGLTALGYLVHHSGYIVTHKDDTRIEWDFLEEICDNLNEEDAVILDDYHMISCFFPIRDLTGAYCYPVFGEDISQTADRLMALGRDVYYLGGTEELPQGCAIIGEWEVGYYEYAGLENAGVSDPLKMADSSFKSVWRLARLHTFNRTD